MFCIEIALLQYIYSLFNIVSAQKQMYEFTSSSALIVELINFSPQGNDRQPSSLVYLTHEFD